MGGVVLVSPVPLLPGVGSAPGKGPGSAPIMGAQSAILMLASKARASARRKRWRVCRSRATVLDNTNAPSALGATALANDRERGANARATAARSARVGDEVPVAARSRGSTKAPTI